MIPIIHTLLQSKKSREVIVILLAVSVTFILLGVALLSNKADDSDVSFEDYQTIDYELNGKDVRLLVADTPQKQTKGLMYIREKPENIDGMLFSFDNERIRFFWNKNTYVDLTLYWIRGDEVVGTSELPSIEKTDQIHTVQSPEEVDAVVEIIK